MDLTDSIIAAESDGDATARNPGSSAYGAGQFLAGTWLPLIKQYRPDLAAGKTDSQLLALRADPVLSRQMTGYYAQDNGQTLSQAGFQPTAGNLHLAHFAGPGGAKAILSADPSAPASQVLGPSVIAANPFLANMNAGDVTAWAGRRAGDAAAATGGTSGATMDQTGFLPQIAAPDASGAAIDLGDMPSERKKAMAQALMQGAMGRSGSLNSPVGVLSALAQFAAGNYAGQQYETQSNERNKRLAQALMGAQGNDQLIRTLMGTGDPDLIKAGVSAQLAQQKVLPSFGQIGEDQFGNKKFGFIDTRAQTTTPAQGPSASEPAIDTSTTGSEFLGKLDKPIADQVKALAEGRMQFPAGFALKSPYWQRMIQMVSQYDPNFDAVNYNARAKTRADFTSGKSAQSINAINTAMGHLGELSNEAAKLNNYSFTPFNTVANLYENARGDPRVNNFNTVRDKVAEEFTRVYRGSGGSESDIKREITNLNAANSPEQLHGAIQKMAQLARSKVEAFGDQYSQGMGTTSDPMRLVSPKAKAVFDLVDARAQGGTPPAPDTAGTQPQASPSAAQPAATPPVSGAKQAPDGNWYVPDPNRSGKFLRVDQ